MAHGGGARPDRLRPIFDIRTAGTTFGEPEERSTADPTLAYFREFAAAGPVAHAVLMVSVNDVAAATEVMSHLRPGLFSLECALLVRALIDGSVPGGAIDGLLAAIVGHGAGGAAFVPIVAQLRRCCSAEILTEVLQVPHVTAADLAGLADFGPANVVRLCALLEPWQMVELVSTYFGTSSARSRILALLSIDEVCTLYLGEIGRARKMRNLIAATDRAQIMAPIAVIGEASYALLLSHDLKPAEIASVHTQLAGVSRAAIATAIANLKGVQRWKRLLVMATPHVCLADLMQFGYGLVEPWSWGTGATGPQIGVISTCIVGEQLRTGIATLLTSGLSVAGLAALCASPTFAVSAPRSVRPAVTGAVVSANLVTLSAGRYVQLLDADWDSTNINLLVQAFLVDNGGRTIADWVDIAAHTTNQHANILGFCAVANWNGASIGPLSAAFADNPNALSIANWVTIADNVPVNDHASTITFAQLNGWTWAGIQPYVQAFHLNANFLTANQWREFTYLVAADAHDDIIPLAQLAGWNFQLIHQLVTAHANNNPSGFTALQWATIAGREARPDAQHAIQVAQGDAGRDIILTPEDRFQEIYTDAIRIGLPGWDNLLAAAIGNGRQNVANRAMHDDRSMDRGAWWPRATNMSHWTQGGNTTLTGFVAHVNNAAFFVAFGNHAGPNTYNITWHATGGPLGKYANNQVTI